MGRKLGEVIVILVTLIFMGLIFASFSPSFASDTSISNYRIFIQLQPEKPNSSDLKFWEGSDVRVEFEIRNLKFEKIEQTEDIKKLRILYVWDNLDMTKVIEYQNPFQPLEGEHWLFAYAVDSNGIYQTPATKFLVQYRISKMNVLPTMSQVYVSSENVSWGTQGLPKGNTKTFNESGKSGEITDEATSTSKIISPTPILSKNDLLKTLKSKFSGLFSESRNIWIGLLVVGLILLVFAKVLFRGGKK
jgi:hypothetical protein